MLLMCAIAWFIWRQNKQKHLQSLQSVLFLHVELRMSMKIHGRGGIFKRLIKEEKGFGEAQKLRCSSPKPEHQRKSHKGLYNKIRIIGVWSLQGMIFAMLYSLNHDFIKYAQQGSAIIINNLNFLGKDMGVQRRPVPSSRTKSYRWQSQDWSQDPLTVKPQAPNLWACCLSPRKEWTQMPQSNARPEESGTFFFFKLKESVQWGKGV